MLYRKLRRQTHTGPVKIVVEPRENNFIYVCMHVCMYVYVCIWKYSRIARSFKIHGSYIASLLIIAA